MFTGFLCGWSVDRGTEGQSRGHEQWLLVRHGNVYSERIFQFLFQFDFPDSHV